MGVTESGAEPAAEAPPGEAEALGPSLLFSPPADAPPCARLDRARARLAVDALDPSAWADVVAEAVSRPLPSARPLFEDALSALPTASAVWVAAVEAELRGGSPQRAGALFARSLLSVPTVELWALYVRHVASTHDSATPGGAAAVRGAHEFAVENVGVDPTSGSLWCDYISFLRSAPPEALHPGAAQPESGVMGDVRRAYTAALSTPHDKLEQLWRDYEAWENGLSRQLARPLLAELAPKHAAAKAAQPERRRLYDAARRAQPPLPPPPPGRPGAAGAEAAWAAWGAVVAHECGEGGGAGAAPHPPPPLPRARHAWHCVTSFFASWPEAWAGCADWHTRCGRPGDAAAAARAGASANPSCPLLAVIASEAAEAAGDGRGGVEGLERALAAAAAARPPDTPAPQHMGSDEAALWCALLRCVRRVEGGAAARRAFARARKAVAASAASGGGAGWRVFAAAAEGEHGAGGDAKVCRNIFELGMTHFGRNADFVLAYASFLSSRLNDTSNARVLFERVFSALSAPHNEPGGDANGGHATGAPGSDEPPAPPASAGELEALWGAFVALEHAHGGPAAGAAASVRRAAALGARFSGPAGPRAVVAEAARRAGLPGGGEGWEAGARRGGDAAPRPSPHGIPALATHAAAAPPRAAPADGGGVVGVGGAPPPAPAAAPFPPASPSDALAAAGYGDLSTFVASLPAFAAVAHLPIPSADAVLSFLGLTQNLAPAQPPSVTGPSPLAISAHVPPFGAAPQGVAGAHGWGAKRARHAHADAGGGVHAAAPTGDLFRARRYNS